MATTIREEVHLDPSVSVALQWEADNGPLKSKAAVMRVAIAEYLDKQALKRIMRERGILNTDDLPEGYR